MCGRFVDPNLQSLGLDTSWLKLNPFPQRYNVKPTNEVVILAKSPLVPMVARWWLVPSWFEGEQAKDWKPTTFNARFEEARDKPSFRNVWKHGRCLIPAAGFYEWSGAKGKRQPNFIQPAGNEEVMFFAGLASRWRDLLTCTILTRPANDSMSDLHDRMPVILNLEERESWLAGSDSPDLGAEAKLRHFPVRPFGMNDEGPELIEPLIEPLEESPQRRLI